MEMIKIINGDRRRPAVWDDALLCAAKTTPMCTGYPCRRCSDCDRATLRFCTHEADHFGGRGFVGRE